MASGFQPARVVSFAAAANGAAFRSRRNWYGLKFRCQLAGDGESVVGFEFLVGDLVPREKWGRAWPAGGALT
ncbi:DUF930 domain-containing protein [Mesorhizobium sp. CO1-1-8]|uniref:DUF930 domain-containing protein n=1 Tax=Mesorhizobium sp. CO1-1-8 TaxID=2876631 RepID=UPI001CD0F5CC|nr:DUF930 domain-containing protein [Mesorhizobium sp. CO1-1-8]MBZ9776633.1 DUF930 domain-containing protein [Mesorhizobium sp. CO1-1-8]